MHQLKILGSGNAFNEEGRFNSSYLLEHQDQKILVDCGFTTPLALQNCTIEFNEIDYVFITHYHGDHYAGLAAFLLGLKYVSLQKKKLKIVGPDDVKGNVVKLLSVLYKGNEGIVDTLDIDFVSVSSKGDLVDFLNFKVEVIPMVHTVDSFPVGYCFDLINTIIGFSGDSGWHRGIEELIEKSDTVLLECNFIRNLSDSHLCIEQLESSEVVQKKKANIYLTHLNKTVAVEAKRLGYNCLEDELQLNLQ